MSGLYVFFLNIKLQTKQSSTQREKIEIDISQLRTNLMCASQLLEIFRLAASFLGFTTHSAQFHIPYQSKLTSFFDSLEHD